MGTRFVQGLSVQARDGVTRAQLVRDGSLGHSDGMSRILLTGMSGTGKTTLLEELARRGHHTVDTDYGNWTRSDGTWHEGRMDELLTRSDVIVSGTVENQGKFYDRFQHVVLLTAPLAVLIERVQRRTNNPYGKSPAEQAEIAHYLQTVEPLLRSGATLELDARRPVVELADAVEALIALQP